MGGKRAHHAVTANPAKTVSHFFQPFSLAAPLTTRSIECELVLIGT